jgi:uncharacterized protein YegL
MTMLLGQFPPARMLPVILLADRSGSMSEDGKIESLNHAIHTMIRVLAQADDRDSEIHLAIIGIGGEFAELKNSLTPIGEFAFEPLQADGETPTGSALNLAAQLIADDEAIPPNAHHPILVLVTDGYPTDNFDRALDQFERTELGAGSTRFALGIGADAHRDHLERFASDGDAGVLGTEQIADIDRFFRFVTRTVTRHLPTMTTGGTSPESLGDFADDELPHP